MKTKKLVQLTETFCPEKVELTEAVLDEAGAVVKPAHLQLTFGRVDEINENGRRYRKSIMEGQFAANADKIKNKMIFMEADHPSDNKSHLDRTASIITDVGILEDGRIVGGADLVETRVGNDIKAIIKGGGKVQVSQRGYGTTTIEEIEKDGKKIKFQDVDETYQWQTYDFVIGASVLDAGVDSIKETKEDKEEEETMGDKKEKLEIKDIAQLEADYPELHKQMLESVKADADAKLLEAVKLEKEQAEAKVKGEFAEQLTSLTEAVTGLQEKLLKKEEPVKEEKDDSVMVALTEQLKTLNAKVDEQEKALKTSKLEEHITKSLGTEAYADDIRAMVSGNTIEEIDISIKESRERITAILEKASKVPAGVGIYQPENDQLDDVSLLKESQAMLAGLEPLSEEKKED